MENRRFGALSSSVDPQKLSKTVEGILKLAAGLLVAFGVLDAVDASQLIENILKLVSLGFSAYGLAEAIFGILRKVVVKVASR